MASSGTGRRRRRWLVVAAALSLLALLINATVSSGSSTQARVIAGQGFLDQVRPLVTRSTNEGTDIADVRNNAGKLGRDGVMARLARVSRDADDVLTQARRLKAPANMATARDLLMATFAIRKETTVAVTKGLTAAVSKGSTDDAVGQLLEAGRDLLAGDRSYQLFQRDVSPKVGDVEDSQWVTDADSWSEPVLAAFVAGLRSSAAASPIHDLRVVLVTTDPVPVGTEGTSEVLPTAKLLKLQIVVANVGNEAEKRLTVSATITPASIGPSDTSRDFVDLTPGQRKTVLLGTLRPTPGTPTALLIHIDTAPGEANTADNERTLSFVMR
jgi:hypothetical protein